MRHKVHNKSQYNLTTFVICFINWCMCIVFLMFQMSICHIEFKINDLSFGCPYKNAFDINNWFPELVTVRPFDSWLHVFIYLLIYVFMIYDIIHVLQPTVKLSHICSDRLTQTCHCKVILLSTIVILWSTWGTSFIIIFALLKQWSLFSDSLTNYHPLPYTYTVYL